MKIYFLESNAQDQERAVRVCLNPFDGRDLQPCTSLILVGALLILGDGPRCLGAIKLLSSFLISFTQRQFDNAFSHMLLCLQPDIIRNVVVSINRISPYDSN